MMVPPGTTAPPNALKPNRCAFESRPFREVPCPFLCAMIPVSSLSFRLPAVSFQLLLLFRRSLFRRRLLSHGLFLCRSLMSLRLGFDVFRLYRSSLLRLGNLLGKFRSSELLPIKCNLGNPHRGIDLKMSPQFLVLLFAFVVENKDFL